MNNILIIINKESIYIFVLVILSLYIAYTYITKPITYKHSKDCKCYDCVNKDRLHNQGWKSAPDYEKYPEHGYPKPKPRSKPTPEK